MSRYTYAQNVCIKKAGLALQRTKALWPGCRIGVAVSGGVDSFVLLKSLKIRQGILPFAIEIMALHLNPGFEPGNHSPLLDWLQSEGISGHIERTQYGLEAHSPVNRKKSACFYCAMRRRKRLFELCGQYNLTHLAFGHNADDLLTTFMLNLCRTAKVRGMDISASFFGGQLTVIRPLLLVEKTTIRKAAAQWSLPVWQNKCPSANHTDRALVNDISWQIDKSIPHARASILTALTNWQLDTNTNDET